MRIVFLDESPSLSMTTSTSRFSRSWELTQGIPTPQRKRSSSGLLVLKSVVPNKVRITPRVIEAVDSLQ